MNTLVLQNGKEFKIVPYDKKRFGEIKNAPEGFLEYLKTLPLEKQMYRYVFGGSSGRSRIYAGEEETSSVDYDSEYVIAFCSPSFVQIIVDMDNNVIVGLYWDFDDSYMLAGDNYTEESEEENNGAGYKYSYCSHYLTCLVPGTDK